MLNPFRNRNEIESRAVVKISKYRAPQVKQIAMFNLFVISLGEAVQAVLHSDFG